MGTLLLYTVYNDDKSIRAGLDIVLHELLIFKLVNNEYELFQCIKHEPCIPSNLAISGDGKVIMMTKNSSRSIGIVYVYKQTGSSYLFSRSIYSDNPHTGDCFGNNIVLDYEGNVVSIS